MEVPSEKKPAETKKTPIEPRREDDVSDKSIEALQRLEGKIPVDETEQTGERKLPWIIDIFLYPISVPGLTMLGIFIGVPLLMEVFVKVLFLFTEGFPPFYVFAVFFLVISLIINIIIRLYRYWYLSECIRDSAEGRIRTPETVASTPGLWELFSIFLKMFVCIIVLSAPMYFYLLKSMGIERSFESLFGFTIFFLWTMVTEVGRSGITFHLLLLFAVFFFPMTILSVVMFDSYRGLNPLLIVSSIFGTFAPYCGLILLLCVLWLPVILIRKFIVTQVVSFQSSLFLYIPRAISIYLMLVGGHLLGRFYWWHKDKLDWGI